MFGISDRAAASAALVSRSSASRAGRHGLEVGDFGLQPLRLGRVLARHGLADFPGGRVPSLLHSLEPGDRTLSAIVQFDQMGAERVETTRAAALVKRFRIVPYPSDVVHVSSATQAGISPEANRQDRPQTEVGDADARFFSIIRTATMAPS